MAAGGRMFVAVDVPAAVRDQIDAVVTPLRHAEPGLRWVDARGWHVTLAFLGPVDAARLEAVDTVLGQVADATAPLRVALDGRAGHFGAGVLWAGLEAQPALAHLAGAVQEALAPAGFLFPARPFRGHLTLARAGSPGPAPAVLAALARRYAGPATAWTVTHITLLASRPGRPGLYTRRGSWPLGACP